MTKLTDKFKPRGRVEVFTTRGKPRLVNGEEWEIVLPQYIKKNFPNYKPRKIYKSCEIIFKDSPILDKFVAENLVVDTGKDRVIEGLTVGIINVIARMAIGDKGTIPSDPTQPKVVLPTADTLFNEIYRDDIDTTVLNVGTPGVHEVLFIKTFSAVDIPITSFSNQANPVINEVGLITADLLGGNPLPRPPVAFPATPDADEKLFAMRTFKTVPFEAANQISVTVRYTIFIE